MSSLKKNSDTSIRVLETLKVLSKGCASIQDILRHFEKIEPNNRIYTSEVILKYINTLKVFGFRIVKEKDKYVLLNSLSQFNFSDADLKMLSLLDGFANEFPETEVKAQVSGFLQDLERRFDDKTRILSSSINRPILDNFKFKYNKYSNQIKEYEAYCTDSRRLKIKYKEDGRFEKSIIVEPFDIMYIDSEVYFCVYNSTLAQVQNINFEWILSIEQFPSRSNIQNMFSSVTFKLKDRLAKAYKLHEDEKILNINGDGSIVVMNQKEDRKLLLKRLMRYGEYCEVVTPQSYRAEMKQLIESTIANYN